MDGIMVAATVGFIGIVASWFFLPGNRTKETPAPAMKMETAQQSAKA